MLNRPLAIAALALGAWVLVYPGAARAELEPGTRSNIDEKQVPPPAKKDRRRFLFELKFGPYTPEVDSELKNGSAYAKVYRGPKLMTQLEFDVEVLHFRRLGTFALGFTWGYFRANANALRSPINRVADTTAFTIMPLIGQVIWRYDVLAMHYKVPIVPYFKAGLDWFLYNITDGNGSTAVCNGLCKPNDNGTGKGGTYGFNLTFGGAFLLDFIDRYTAKIARHEVGLYHTYVFGEFNIAVINDFGKDGALNVGSKYFLVGLSFEF